MLRTLATLVAISALATAATVDRNQRQPPPAAQNRDGASHGGGSSSYNAPAASSYSGGGGGGGGNEQGNLYYYYYPVEEYGGTEAADAGFDVFTAIILPLLILGGLLLALSSFTFNFSGGRSMGTEGVERTVTEQLQDEVERIFYIYLNTFESEGCIKRTICESGVYARNFKSKDFYFNLAEPFVPETMRGNMAIFKMAAKDGFDTGKCKKHRCNAPKIFQQ